MLLLDIKGQSFGDWTVIDRVPRKPGAKGNARWLCHCKCGAEAIKSSGDLRGGSTTRCRSCYAQAQHKQGAAFRRLLRSYKDNAISRNLAWELTEEAFRTLTSSPCYYTGIMPEQKVTACSGEVYLYNGIDRLDPTKGYTTENCVPCCADANIGKMALTKDQFITMCMRITMHELNRDEPTLKQIITAVGGQVPAITK